jgi:predicted DNA-binding transcriptional regulator AlpA
MPDLAALLANPRLIAGLSQEEAVAAIAELTGLQAVLATRFRQLPQRVVPTAIAEPDRLLEPAEVAQRLGVTIRWLYSHADKLPFTRRLGRKVLRFSELGLKRYMAQQRA